MERVGLRPEQADRYPHQFSGGQRPAHRHCRALAVEPEFIIADEPVSALDVSIQAQILNLMMDLKDEFHFSYLFISHDLSVVKHISDRLGVMYLGALVECGSKQDLFERMSHPYTKMLLSAVPTVGEKPLVESMEMVGEIPSPIDLPSGCFFHGRLPLCNAHLQPAAPELKQIDRAIMFLAIFARERKIKIKTESGGEQDGSGRPFPFGAARRQRLRLARLHGHAFYAVLPQAAGKGNHVHRYRGERPGQHGQRNAGKTDGARGEQCRGYAERILCNQPYRYGDHLVS